MRSGRFVALDSWRGIAALMVALFHFRSTSHIADTPFILNSWMFVDLFFVLSGFVISHSYFSRLANPAQVQQFIVLRFGRLYPLHFAMLALYVGCELLKLAAVHFTGLTFDDVPFTGHRTVPSIFTNLLMIHALGMHDQLTWNEPSWSISVEFFVYLVFAAVVFYARRPKLWLALLAGTGCLVLALFSDIGFGAANGYGFFRALYGFCVGHFVWSAVMAAQQNTALMARLKRHATPIEIAVTALTLAFVTYGATTPFTYAAPFVFSVTIFVFALELGALSRGLTIAPFRRLGDLSYSVYMVHGWLIWAFGVALGPIAEKAIHLRLANMNDNMLVFGSSVWVGDALTVVYTVAVIAMSVATYNLIEKPGRDYFKALAKRLPTRQARTVQPASSEAAS